ncbi:hypothetical protein AVEN_212445-1 [Araneus ventricosus]|uniref:Uncharacterized protein n=1 Tax=Araneus ventricosus TaxID=182803 RepID=A0A4Y2V8S1_ARAVE|nr:hypothetical protein AVEN_212445-1 [Araneus ventricosus]
MRDSYAEATPAGLLRYEVNEAGQPANTLREAGLTFISSGSLKCHPPKKVRREFPNKWAATPGIQALRESSCHSKAPTPSLMVK